jgi:hypothetical protein
MVPGAAEARSEACHTVDYGGYADRACYVASLSSPDPSGPVVDCVVNNHTAGDYKVVIVFHSQDGAWVPVGSGTSDTSTWLETSFNASGASLSDGSGRGGSGRGANPTDYLCWGGVYSEDGGALLDAAVQYPS